MLNVFSIFSSIQGESTRAGLPCVFIRLAGCPLCCSYCDSRPAAESSGVEMSISQILNNVNLFGKNLVEVTGGEPLAQQETSSLLTCLCDLNFEVLLETSGAFPIANLDPRVRIIMDVKCPDSNMSDHILISNFVHLNRFNHELKFVVSSRSDFNWAVVFIEKNGLSSHELLFSPASGLVSLEMLAKWILSSQYSLRLQPQLHKIIWPDSDIEV